MLIKNADFKKNKNNNEKMQEIFSGIFFHRMAELTIYYKNLFILVQRGGFEPFKIYDMKKIIKCFWPMFLGIGVCILYQKLLKNSELLLDQTIISNMISQIISEEKQQLEFFLYILKLRGSQIAVLVIFRLLKKEKIGNFLWLWMLGVGMGIGAYYLVSIYQFFGLILFLAFLFPHYIFYLFAYYKCTMNDQNSQYVMKKKASKKSYVAQKLGISIVVIIGVLSEFYVNPYVINFFGKIIYIKNYKI